MGETTSINFSLPLLLGAILGMLLLSIAIVFFFVVYQRRLLRQQRLRAEEERRHQRELLEAAIEVQENERRRIAGDLHDDIGSLLSAARLYLKQLKSPDQQDQHIKQETLGILDRMITNARRITHDLMPTELEKFGFFAATQDLFQRINETGAIWVSFEHCPDRRMPFQTEVALYRVVQELLNNTLKHAAAQRISFHCEWRNDKLILNYSDNGRGFIPAQRGERGRSGLGLRNMESRISLLGGNLTTTSAPGRGTAVTIELPHVET